MKSISRHTNLIQISAKFWEKKPWYVLLVDWCIFPDSSQLLQNRRYKNMKKWRHVMQKRYVVRQKRRPTLHMWLLKGTFCNQPEISTTYGTKALAQIMIFMFWWPWPLLSYKVVMQCWSLHAKFHKNPSSINVWYDRGHTHKHNHTQGENKSLANPFGARLNISRFEHH